MRLAPIPDAEVWPEGERCVLWPPDGDPTGSIRPVEVVKDTVDLDGCVIERYNVRVQLDPSEIEALRANPVLWVSTLGEHFHPMTVGLAPTGLERTSQ